MRYIAIKSQGLYLTEHDWNPAAKEEKSYSFTPEMVKKKTPLDLPENNFIHGLAAEKLIVAVKGKTQKEVKTEAENAPPPSSRRVASEDSDED